MTEKDNIALKKFILIRKDTEDEEYKPEEATNYLFVVSINEYQHWPKLYNAVQDAKIFTQALVTNYTFDKENVTYLFDTAATRTSIYNKLREYIEIVGPQDNLVIYFSGHGYFDEMINEGYWVPYNAHTGNEGEYLPNTSIVKVLQNIDSRHTLLIADACFSGALFADASRGYVENVEKYKSRWGLTSGRLEAVSDGEAGKHSPFAQTLIKYLLKNPKNKLAISEPIQHVKMNVAEISNQTPIGSPLKNVGDEGGELILYKRETKVE